MTDLNQNLYQNLTASLDQLVKVYRGLLELIRKEKDLLVSADMDELSENNKAKEAMLNKIKLLEQSRMKISRDLAKDVNVNVDTPRLLEIASRFDGELGDRLRNLHSVLELLLKRVSEINRENEVLVATALQNVGGAMDAIKDTLQEKPTYQKKGALAATPASAAGQLVSREA